MNIKIKNNDWKIKKLIATTIASGKNISLDKDLYQMLSILKKNNRIYIFADTRLNQKLWYIRFNRVSKAKHEKIDNSKKVYVNR